MSLYHAHKGKRIQIDQLKWGEEMEYQLGVSICDPDGKSSRMKMSNRGPELIKEFNTNPVAAASKIVLMPEFGGWMIEAVPTEPYMSQIDPEILLSCEKQISLRRKVLTEFLKPYNHFITTMPNAPALGT